MCPQPVQMRGVRRWSKFWPNPHFGPYLNWLLNHFLNFGPFCFEGPAILHTCSFPSYSFLYLCNCHTKETISGAITHTYLAWHKLRNTITSSLNWIEIFIDGKMLQLAHFDPSVIQWVEEGPTIYTYCKDISYLTFPWEPLLYNFFLGENFEKIF